MKRLNYLLGFLGLVALVYSAVGVQAQTRRTIPPLELQWKSKQIISWCETTTGNRIYFAYDHGHGGMFVIPGDCP